MFQNSLKQININKITQNKIIQNFKRTNLNSIIEPYKQSLKAKLVQKYASHKPITCISGATVGGLAFALALNKKGLSCEVLSCSLRQDIKQATPKTILLSANSMQILEDLGIANQIIPKSQKLKRYAVLNSTGEIGSIDFFNAKFPSLGVQKGLFVELLLRELNKRKVPVRDRCTVTSFFPVEPATQPLYSNYGWKPRGNKPPAKLPPTEKTINRVKSIERARMTRELEAKLGGVRVNFSFWRPPYEFDLLVGAEGSKSFIRDRLFPDNFLAPKRAEEELIPNFESVYLTWAEYHVVVPRLDIFDPNIAYEIWGETCKLFITPMEYHQSFISITVPNFKNRNTYKMKPGPRELSKIIPILKADFKNNLAVILIQFLSNTANNLDCSVDYPLKLHLENWSSGQITLLGESAHAMPRYFGQSEAMDIEDGYILANLLSSVNTSDYTVKDALIDYEKTRKESVTTVQNTVASLHLPSKDGEKMWQKMSEQIKNLETSQSNKLLL
eukprot:TRINITY_DN773_c2_g1_i1.p1 TRINITY_DN773_c2_g1~~TRINITY_DN773_c2_g1_i1.p1  ORF type:complete len:534 (+),score=190.58 TRINITY_DN773_c2_g1_i1:101-1603(+)